MKQGEQWRCGSWGAARLLFLVSFFALLAFIAAELTEFWYRCGVRHSAPFRLLFAVVLCALFYCAGVLHTKRSRQSRVLFYLMILFFLLYLYLIVSFTLLDPSLGRGTASVYTDFAHRHREYAARFVNLRPFQSIWEVYIQGLLGGYLHPYYVLLNLLGNICAFMPMSFFLPLFFKTQKRPFVFLPTMILTVLVVEGLQFVLMVGSCDVDDLILNVSGAMLAYALFRIPSVNKFFERMTNTHLRIKCEMRNAKCEMRNEKCEARNAE